MMLLGSGLVGLAGLGLDAIAAFEEIPPPRGFAGTLRPYQARGYSWLRLLTQWGLGACLADDMGLGKTIQALALVQHCRESGAPGPVFLACPTSVVNNWKKEAEKQALVISSYALMHRDVEHLRQVSWSGVILATLSKLKQVCNHPAHFLGDNSRIPDRSGKLARLTEMLEEILEAGERALVFSQFAEMGGIMKRHIQETFGREVLFLHGGVPKGQRDRMVDRFQSEGDGPPVFILSLKAGGTGLNLTRASHVFHFDRWWNPAVENQATDRAFRIGQTRNVQVHKFLCAGTLEEKIDEMIERKKEIAGKIVGAGEGWLTELSNAALKDLMALRREAVCE
jgi:SNF2 family DNA or RNA helicase